MLRMHSHFDQIPAQWCSCVTGGEGYKYLGFDVHATKKLTFGTAPPSLSYGKKGSICYETALCTLGHT